MINQNELSILTNGQTITKNNDPIEDKKEVIDYEDGSRYEGNLEDGKKSGQGKLEYENGDCFEGEFKDDMRYKGVMIYANKDRFEGYFANDFKRTRSRLHEMQSMRFIS